jgi:hypothetical protein
MTDLNTCTVHLLLLFIIIIIIFYYYYYYVIVIIIILLLLLLLFYCYYYFIIIIILFTTTNKCTINTIKVYITEKYNLYSYMFRHVHVIVREFTSVKLV